MKNRFVWFARTAVYAVSLLNISAAYAQPRYPLCPMEAAQQALPVLRPAITVQVPGEIRRAGLLAQHQVLTLEVRTLPTGKIACVSPMHSGVFGPSFSLLWPLAIEAIGRELGAQPLPAKEQRFLIVLPYPLPKRRGSVKIVTVPDIRHIPPGGLSDPEVADLTCASNDVDVLLDEVSLARNNLNMDFTFGSYTKEIQCADAAVSLEPGSFALQYVAGMTNDDHTIDRASWANHPKNLSAAVEHFRAAVVLAPNFYEARKGLAEALRESGAFGDAEAEYLKLAQSDNPPPIQQEAEESLTHLYDDANDRPKALLSARTAEHIHETLSSLFGKEQDYTFSMGRADLAAREEEAGEYRQAAEDYLAARTFSSKDDFKANLFDYDTGRARNLRESGDSSDSAALCGEWQSQLFGPLHKLHLSPWWQWGGGLDVEQARWEFSCKDFDKGVQELFQIANSRLDHPHVNKDYRDELTTFFLMAPYEALESAFLYRRQPELARQARALHWRIYKIDHGGSDSEPDQTDIDGIKQLTQKLMSQTVALHPHPPILH